MRINQYIKDYISKRVWRLFNSYLDEIQEPRRKALKEARNKTDHLVDRFVEGINEVMCEYNYDRLDCVFVENLKSNVASCLRNRESNDDLFEERIKADAKVRLAIDEIIARISLEKKLSFEEIDTIIDTVFSKTVFSKTEI